MVIKHYYPYHSAVWYPYHIYGDDLPIRAMIEWCKDNLGPTNVHDQTWYHEVYGNEHGLQLCVSFKHKEECVWFKIVWEE